jgi:hypothetical protein
MVRAKVPNSGDREAFDHWYMTEHLPLAIKTFEPEQAWRCWSLSDPAIHYAFYRLADYKQAEALIGFEKMKPLIADFDRTWGDRVQRRRDVLEIVQELSLHSDVSDDLGQA